VALAVAAAAVAGGIWAAQTGGTGGGQAGYPSASRPGTVLLVPGYGGRTAALEVLAARLRAAGRTATVVALPGDGTGDLEAQAGVLDGYVSRALADGAPSVDVVGYSAGGVVALLWADEHDGAHKARRIVALGSPLHGAMLAALGAALVPGACPVACQQLAPGSGLLDRLQQVPLTGHPSWLSLWTVDDLIVRPPDSARLPGAVNVVLQDVCTGADIQHGELPTDPLVTGIVLRALSAARLTAPGAADCGSLRAAGQQLSAAAQRGAPGG
jgi:pimeloyl-ACP methyl ester carboxylesterase